MSASFFFYDLETTGVNPREGRIMQFAGRRTDLALKPIGEPVDVLISLTDDVIPDPDAILVTGITPQKTRQEGITEAEFLRMFADEIAQPGTIFVGYNTVRFDDEFMRFLHYRNFYDPYEWQWKDGRSRWDLLDVVRLVRALRPDGIKWPFASDGRPTNRLELITELNGLDHANAHDALSDVDATIAVARLIRNKQQKMFEYLLSMRDKKKVSELVLSAQPFIYASGKYPSEFEKTTVAAHIIEHPGKQGVLVYDLRHDPDQFAAMTPEQLVKAWQYQKEPDPKHPRLPVKTLQFNRCPAVAPLGVLDEPSQERLKIDLGVTKKNLAKLKKHPDFGQKLHKALEIMERSRQTQFLADEQDVDTQLYDAFIPDADKQLMRVVRAAAPEELSDLNLHFKDNRLESLLPLYKARNYPNALDPKEREAWENFRSKRLLGGGQSSRLAKFFARLATLAESSGLTQDQRYLLEELQLYGQSIMPVAEE